MSNYKNIRKITYVLVLYFFTCLLSTATHIKAGEFSAKRDPNNALSYDITLTLYYNTLNTDVDPAEVTINFGDGNSQQVTRQSKTDVGNNTTKNVFNVTHTFNGLATYIVGMRDENRNYGIENMPNSGQTAFYVEMQLQVSPFIGLDNTPVMTVPPIDFAAEDKIFTHNPGAYDVDGDSLSYELIPPESAKDLPIPGYAYPADPKFNGTNTIDGGPSFMTLNPSTGELVWNTPGPPYTGASPRYYNIAIKVTEWRSGRAIGYIIRDMQIEVKNTTNDPPKLTIPADLCVEAGTLIQKSFSAIDPNGDNVRLEYFGEPFNVTPNPATAVITNQGGKTPSGVFTWPTACSNVRAQPYNVIFKATDQNTVAHLVDIQTWRIYVKGPKVKNITAVTGTNFITLNWPLYTCSASTDSIRIYRRDCDSVAPVKDPCKSGPLSGYTYIGRVKGNAVTFKDDNKGKGLDKGKSYCYILVAIYPYPGLGESYPSDQVCAELNRDVPVFSTISVTETSSSAGKVYMNWYKPSAASIAGPYQYTIERFTGTNPVASIVATNVVDTFFTDVNLDTKNTLYSYKILLQNNGILTTAIPVMDLTTKSGNASVSLSWKYGTPWTTDSAEVYRKINAAVSFIKIKTVYGKVTTYTDNKSTGIKNCDTVYYYVKQYGRYCDKELTQIAIQTSAIDSVRPLDDTPPKAPVLKVEGCNGDLTIFKDVLNWTNLSDDDCNTIDHYNVYFAPHLKSDVSLLTTTRDTTYTYINNQTTAGCFVVSATNKMKVEGAKSNKVCVDDCVYYELPNLITANNDGLNDVLRPFNYPRGVAKVNFYVYNNWGNLVYFSDQSININWDGKTSNGQMVSDGVYYYLAEITYYGRVNEDDQVREIKSWVQIVTGIQK